jgi:hypothetical protein
MQIENCYVGNAQFEVFNSHFSFFNLQSVAFRWLAASAMLLYARGTLPTILIEKSGLRQRFVHMRLGCASSLNEY